MKIKVLYRNRPHPYRVSRTLLISLSKGIWNIQAEIMKGKKPARDLEITGWGGGDPEGYSEVYLEDKKDCRIILRLIPENNEEKQIEFFDGIIKNTYKGIAVSDKKFSAAYHRYIRNKLQVSV